LLLVWRRWEDYIARTVAKGVRDYSCINRGEERKFLLPFNNKPLTKETFAFVQWVRVVVGLGMAFGGGIGIS